MHIQIERDEVKHLELFAALDPSGLDKIVSAANGRRYRPGDTVFEQGEQATHFFVLARGRLRVTQVTSEGQQVVIRMVNPGDLFGIAKALARLDYPGTATAVMESCALCWPMRLWTTLLERYPSLAMQAMQTMGSRLLEAQQRVRELSTEEVERRVAHAVLRLANQSGRKERDGVRIDFPISKQDIAEMTGSTLHTVSRILTAWEGVGLVEGGRQKLLVRDPHGLVMVADGLRPGLL
jgi:CRP-like cAMP-binding protein